MDGDGSIQVNHWRYKNLQYRLVIKLKYCDENLKMLNLIEKYIGGYVRIIGIGKASKFVIWVVNDKKQINNIINIFNSYPPITSRLKAQLAFMLECFSKNDVEWYLNERNNKYNKINFNNPIDPAMLSFTPSEPANNIDQPPIGEAAYFNEWLSGFIEAEGCFSIRNTSTNHSFSIGQNNDKYILDMIKTHFFIKNNIRLINNKFWFIEVYNKSVLINIINHCFQFPLLGEKTISFYKFRDLFK